MLSCTSRKNPVPSAFPHGTLHGRTVCHVPTEEAAAGEGTHSHTGYKLLCDMQGRQVRLWEVSVVRQTWTKQTQLHLATVAVHTSTGTHHASSVIPHTLLRAHAERLQLCLIKEACFLHDLLRLAGVVQAHLQPFNI